jgi:hypothetical protein
MSRGPGKIRWVIYDLFVRLGWLDRRYTLTDLYLTEHRPIDPSREIYRTDKPTREQQVSALRAAHVEGAGRVLRTKGRTLYSQDSVGS